MKNIFISGATGFIGQRFVKAVDANIRLISRRNQPGYETIVCNLQSEAIPNDALNGIDTVFHLAGYAHDLDDAASQELYQRINVDATIRLAEIAVKSNVKRFIFLSSVKAGGSPPLGICASEEDQSDPKGFYGKTKREAELKLLKIGKEFGLHVSIIRSSLVYGPNVKGNLKEMLSGINKGWFPPLPDTRNKKSMIHVDDLVRAILFVASDNRTNGEIFIATDGIPHSSREIYNVVCTLLNKRIPKWSVPKILFDIASFVSPYLRYKLIKLLGDECYCSSKLALLGFRTKKILKDMNETSF